MRLCLGGLALLLARRPCTAFTGFSSSVLGVSFHIQLHAGFVLFIKVVRPFGESNGRQALVKPSQGFHPMAIFLGLAALNFKQLECEA
jgi:hypothetical protein